MFRILVAALAASWATSAVASDKLVFEPAGDWVKPAAAVKVQAAPESGPPVRSLWTDQQVRFTPVGTDLYSERADQVRSAIGLQSIGTVIINWDPAHEQISIHKLRILRGDQKIDVLATQSFRITHSESNLEEEVDGDLTASLQPEDLRVGDVVEFAYTRTRSDPVMKGHADEVIGLTGRTERQTFRAVYPNDLPIEVRAGRGLAPPKRTRGASTTELTLERTKVEVPKNTAGAPARYRRQDILEFSSFRSWSEISAMMAPLFQAASEIAPTSPLRAEIARIRAASDDPKVRAGAALKLVEDNVRYMALVLSDGGYTPVAADVTWARRFGDCKAKTVLLVGLLRELGIQAEPALVNAYGSPDLDTHLPRLSAFNHVIVRTEIAGKTYWLDATRSGDESLIALETPPHDFALPVRSEGAALLSLARTPREAPDTEVRMTIDARNGIEASAPVHAEMVMRGDAGLWPALLTANMTAPDREKLLKGMWRQSWIEVKSVAATHDPETGESRMTMDGVAKMIWFTTSSGPIYPVFEATLGERYLPKREDSAEKDLPYVVSGYPTHTLYSLTLLPPEGGVGFSLPAPDIDKILGGVRYVRHSKVTDGKIVIETETRALQPEISAAEAKATTDELAQMASQQVMIQGPRFYHPTAGDISAWLAREPGTAAELVDLGGRLAYVGRFKDALADMNKAVDRDPAYPAAYAARGLLHLQMGETALGKIDLDKASALGTRNAGVQSGLGLLAMSEGRLDDAVVAFTRAMDMAPNNIFALRMRANVFKTLGQTDKALADLDELLEMDPKAAEAYVNKADLYFGQGDLQKALEATDAALTLTPNEPSLLVLRAALLSKLDRREEADRAFETSLRIRPMASTYLTRAQNRPKADFQARQTDIDAAEKLEPDNLSVISMRANLLLDRGKGQQALALLSKSITAHPDRKPNLLLDRATIAVKVGRTDLAIQDFAALRSLAGQNPLRLNALCWSQAILGVSLEAALADCEASLKAQPKIAATLDSKGFVLLRLGRLDQSIQAYDEAVRLRPEQAQSLYGRGLAKLRLGRTSEAEADLAAARAHLKTVDEEFAGYGLKPEG
jgi:tetratricopeptide (TPR) repeat protein